MDDVMELEAPAQIVIPYAPRPWQREMHRKLKRFNVLVVHRGAGKTIMAINELIRKALSGPPEAEYVYLLPLKNQAHRNVWLPLKRHVEPLPYVKCNNNTLEVYLPNDAKIMVLGADDPEKLRGLHLHGIVLDEFADMHPNTWRAVRPMLSNHNGWVIWIGTPRGHNEFYRKYLQSQEDNRPHWFGEILPWWKTRALKDEEVELMRSEMLPEEFAQELECSFEAALVGSYYGRALADLRDAGRITDVKLYRDDLEVYTAWDLGIRDRMAVWWFQLQKDDIVFIDYEEHSNYGLRDWAEIIRLKERNYGYRYAVHISPHDIKNRELGSGISRLESAEEFGIHFEVCPKQDVMDGIELVRRHLPRCRFQAVMCADGLEALSMYKAKVDKAGQGLGPEHSVFSHACLTGDALVRMHDGFKRIDEIIVGDRIWTPAGPSKVLHAGLVKHVTQLLHIELADGRLLRCTPEHKILTKRGFLRADMIRYSDEIFSGDEYSCFLIRLLSMATLTGFRATITGETCGDRTVPATFIEQFGKTSTGRSLMAIMSTTRMVIRSTTTSAISNWLKPAITFANILWSDLPTVPWDLRVSLLFDGPPNGIDLKKAGSGIGRTASTPLPRKSGIRAFASSAVSRLCRRFLRAPSSATPIAKLSLCAHDEVPVPTYDITVENHACYQANGVLVSNSDSLRYAITHIVQVLQMPQLVRMPFLRSR